jgi:hypothetical protein
MAAAIDLQCLETPVPAWLHRGQEGGSVEEQLSDIDELVVEPLKKAVDDDAWHQVLVRVTPAWLELRLALGQASVNALGMEALVDAVALASALPLTLLPTPAYGAARYAVELLVWLSRSVFGAAASRPYVGDVYALHELVKEIAVMELCWLTLLGPERPNAQVAEAAAWEAYSRARPLGVIVRDVGLEFEGYPTETPEEAVERGLAQLERLSSGWTSAYTDAVESVQGRGSFADR